MNTAQNIKIVDNVHHVEAKGALPSLIAYLESLPSGPIEASSPVERLLDLSKCYVSSDEPMDLSQWHIVPRIENMVWDSPLLTFTVPSRDNPKSKSTRKELWHWCFNAITEEIRLDRIGYRQILPRSKNINVTKLAAEVVEDILANRQSDRLKWHPDGRVQVLVSKVIPKACIQTTTGRRFRFQSVLDAMLSQQGWVKVVNYTYRLASDAWRWVEFDHAAREKVRLRKLAKLNAMLQTD